MLVGHFLVTSLEWRNTEYVVSERQVLIRHGIFQPVLTHFSLHGAHTVVEMHGVDIGNLMFKPRAGQATAPTQATRPCGPTPPTTSRLPLHTRPPSGAADNRAGAKLKRRRRPKTKDDEAQRDHKDEMGFRLSGERWLIGPDILRQD